MNAPELQAEIKRLSDQMDATQKELKQATITWATSERDYRKSKRTAWISLQSKKLTVPEKEAEVAGITADERYKRDQADGDKTTLIESLRNLRSQISAVTTLVALHRSEMELGR